jgi:GNAT superfamily N-acetyltransferase
MDPKRIAKTDKAGNTFEIGCSCAEDFSSLLEMYRVFSPKPASLGLPPEDPETCQDWVKRLFNTGQNLFAWRGGSIVGHAALIPDTKHESGEFVIFVKQNHRSLGIGTALTRFTLEKSRQLGLNSVWLTVNIRNFIAVKLYKKLGFEYCDTENSERVMSIKLK